MSIKKDDDILITLACLIHIKTTRKILLEPIIELIGIKMELYIFFRVSSFIMNSATSLLLALLFIWGSSAALIYIPGVPVNPLTLYQLQVACNILQADLNNYPSLPSTYAYNFYGDVYLANYFLTQVANDPGIVNYNNVLYGANNIAAGNKNIIFGNGNTVSGSNNYIFSSDFNGTAVSSDSLNSNLVLDNWVIQLLKMYLIPFGPTQAIQKWK